MRCTVESPSVTHHPGAPEYLQPTQRSAGLRSPTGRRATPPQRNEPLSHQTNAGTQTFAADDAQAPAHVAPAIDAIDDNLDDMDFLLDEIENRIAPLA